MDFFKRLIDSNDPLSSKRFISLVGLVLLIMVVIGAMFGITVADVIIVTLASLILGSSTLTTIGRNDNRKDNKPNDKLTTSNNDWTNGLSIRHIAQIIRRKMLQQVIPSKKIYNRKKWKQKTD